MKFGDEEDGVDVCEVEEGDGMGNRATSGNVPARKAAREDSVTCRRDGASSQPRSRAAFNTRRRGEGERRDGERGVKAGVDITQDGDGAEEKEEDGGGRERG